MDLDDEAMIFNTMQDGVPEVDMQYLQNRNISGTNYGSKEKRGKSSRNGSSKRKLPLSILTPSSQNFSRKPKKHHSRTKSSYRAQESQYSGSKNRSKDLSHADLDYDLNHSYKDSHYSHKNLKNSRSGHRKKRDHNKSKENYYHALESMLSKA